MDMSVIWIPVSYRYVLSYGIVQIVSTQYETIKLLIYEDMLQTAERTRIRSSA